MPWLRSFALVDTVVCHFTVWGYTRGSPPTLPCPLPMPLLRLDDQRAEHAGLTVGRDGAVECKHPSSGGFEECQARLAALHRYVDVECVEVEAVGGRVGVVQAQ